MRAGSAPVALPPPPPRSSSGRGSGRATCSLSSGAPRRRCGPHAPTAAAAAAAAERRRRRRRRRRAPRAAVRPCARSRRSRPASASLRHLAPRQQPAGRWVPVLDTARRQLHTLQLDPAGVAGAAGARRAAAAVRRGGGCLAPRRGAAAVGGGARAAADARRGRGSDGVNAATWRVVPQPPPGEATGGAATGGAATAGRSGRAVVFEAFDRPGYVLTAGDGAAGPLLAGAPSTHQRCGSASCPRGRRATTGRSAADAASGRRGAAIRSRERRALGCGSSQPTPTPRRPVRRLPSAGGGGVPAGAAVFVLRAARNLPALLLGTSGATQQLGRAATTAGAHEPWHLSDVPLNELLDESYSRTCAYCHLAARRPNGVHE